MDMKLVDEPRAKIVLFYPRLQEGQWPMWAPQEPYAIGTTLMHRGYEVTIIDERVDEDPYGQVERALEGALLAWSPNATQLRTPCSTAGSLAIPFHERGSLARLAGSLGFEVRHQKELTANVIPTLKILTERLHAKHRQLIDFFGGSRLQIASEIEELRVQLEHLAQGFAGRHLAYEEVGIRSNTCP